MTVPPITLKGRLIGSLLAWAAAGSVSAAETVLNPVQVTATRVPQSTEQSLASVTVIDRDTLRRQNPTDLGDVLRGQPGVDVSSSGSFGKSESVFIRGASGAASSLLIDGIRIRSVSLGAPSYELLDPRLFDRVEIVRGPRSSLYGSDASGGVIQLFTREPQGDKPHPWASFGGGSFNTYRAGAGVSGVQDNTQYSLAISGLDTNGATLRRGGSHKSYDNGSGFVRLAHRFANDVQIGGLFLHGKGNTEYEGGEDDFVQQVAGLWGEVPVTDNWSSRLTLSEVKDERDSHLQFMGVTSKFRYNSRTRTANWQNNIFLGPHQLVAGAEYSTDHLDSNEHFEKNSRYNNAVFVQELLDWHPLRLQASLRHDHNEAYGSKTTGELALGYALSDYYTVRTSYGTAFRAPTFNDLYSPLGGNPDIKPEKSQTGELGIRGQFKHWYWDLAAYQSTYKDLINWVPDATGLYAPANVDRARIRGLELASGVKINYWDLSAAATYMQPKDRDTHKDLARRARQSLRLDADRRINERLDAGATLTLQGKRYDNLKNTQRLGGYALFDLRGGWRFSQDWQAQLKINNLLNKRYETSDGFINAGRGVMVSFNYNPGQ